VLVSVVIPVLNEEGNVHILSEKLTAILDIYDGYEILFVDDGSSDGTLNSLKELHEQNDKIKFLSFSRNFGHQAALRAGLDRAVGDCVISMDGDMQHPPEMIQLMIDKWRYEHYDIVYTIRKDDPNLNYLKRASSKLFYKIMNYFSDINIEAGSADFRLMDKSVVEILRGLHEDPLFFRGIIQWVGFRQSAIEYMPAERFWGASKYSFKKMFRFAIDGILSFSIKPLLFAIYLGVIISFFAFGYGLYTVYEALIVKNTVPGWATIITLLSLYGGIQLIVLGIIGLYLGKLSMAFKGRPAYIIKNESSRK